jgi:hypothetical protein
MTGVGSSVAALSQLDVFSADNGFKRVSISVPPRLLIPELPTKWLRTTTRGSAPYDETTAGVIYFSNDADESLGTPGVQWLIIEGVAEFCDQILAADQVTLPTLERSVPTETKIDEFYSSRDSSGLIVTNSQSASTSTPRLPRHESYVKLSSLSGPRCTTQAKSCL